MLKCLEFILLCIVDFIKMLFSIDLGFTNLGTLMCIVYILLPVMLIIVNFFKQQFIDELDEVYDFRSVRHGRFDKESRYIGKHEYRGKHEKR